MYLFWAILFGVLVGWIASLAMRTGTTEGILLDIAAAVLGAVALASLLGNNSTFDSLVAGGLGAILANGILQLVRRRVRG